MDNIDNIKIVGIDVGCCVNINNDLKDWFYK